MKEQGFLECGLRLPGSKGGTDEIQIQSCMSSGNYNLLKLAEEKKKKVGQGR